MNATTAALRPAFRFFHEWAGYCVGERAIGALSLVRAERQAHDAGHSFEWSIDPEIDSSEFSDERPTWALWQCVMRAGCPSDEEGRVLASLHGIDFGREGEPWGDPYRRVVEAELAQVAS